ncbi:hypothetical protein EDB19DRAFT_1918981 [Suillus lakei]|nr:hypothetical protein EDB19DRAFT_1918981 [Suillus lakei]
MSMSLQMRKITCKKIDDGKSSSDEDEDNLDIAPIADSSPQYHVTRDMVSYLKSLSTIPSYHQPSCCQFKSFRQEQI